MRFSQRIGKRKVKVELEKGSLNLELKNSLWTLVLEIIIAPKEEDIDRYGREKWSIRSKFFRSVWIHFFKRPIDNLQIQHGRYYGQVDYISAQHEIREWYYKADWDLALDFIEFCVNYDDNEYTHLFNDFLKSEMSAYRFVDGNLVEINSKEEIIEIESAIKNSGKFNSVRAHLKRAVELYADKEKPDYRNSIKESISAVESLSKIIVQNDKTTLGQALKVIEKKHEIPKSLKSAFSSLYGYTSDEGGIRHSLLEKDFKVDLEEARFMLIACSAFVNYLIGKI